MSGQIIEGRLSKLRHEMREKELDYYLIPTSDFHHSEYVDDYFKVREYFSGFTGSNGTLVVSKEDAGVWTDGRYFIQAEKQLEGTGIRLFRMQEENVPDVPQYLKESMQKGETLGFDGRTVSCSLGLELEKKLKDKEIQISDEEDVAGNLWEERKKLPAGSLFILPGDLCGASVGDKLTAVRKKMKELEVQAFLLSKLDDIMWLFNVRGSDVACNPVALSYGYITMDECYFFVQKDAVDQAFAAYAEENRFQVRDYHEVIPFLKDMKNPGKVLLDRKNISYTLYRTVKNNAEVIFGENPTELLKAKKNETELRQMRDIFIKDSAAVIKFMYWIKKNAGKFPIDELSAGDYMDDLRKEIKEYLDLSFPTICGYRANAAMMHYSASPEAKSDILPEGMLLLDSGGQYLGGTTDVTRTMILGAISPEEKMYFTKVAVGMLRLSNARFLYGCTGRNLDILARQPLWNCDVDYKCGTGHGIGYILNVHEGPQSVRWKYIPGDPEVVLESGMVLSNEPGVYKEGQFGIRTENIIVVREGTKNGDGQFMCFENLTFVPIDRDGIDAAYMQPEDIRSLNDYHAEVYEKVKDHLETEIREWLFEITRPVGKNGS